jgi:hypothetical protein
MGSGRIIKRLQNAALGILAAVTASAALAQASSSPPVMVTGENSPARQILADPFVVSLGIFVVQASNNIDLSGTANARGQSIDFGRTFGTNNNATRFRADALWRITPNQHVMFMYFTNDASGTKTLNKDVEWGNYTFKGNFTATGEVRNSVYELSYEYAFLHDRDYEVAASFGVHYDKITASISGTATITEPDGTVTSASAQSKSASAPAPLPVIGARGWYAATDHLLLTGQAQVFKISYQGINGSWWDLRAEATWLFNHHIGVGLGYDYFDIHASLSKTNFNGDISWGYQGLMAFVRGGF